MRPIATLSGLALVVSLFAACSSSSDDASTPAAAPQGPLTGTYSADSLDGTAPFVAITFMDDSHYQYVAKSCLSVDTNEPGDDDGGVPASTSDLGDDPADQVEDNGAVQDNDANPTDNGCVHSGTYTVSATTLTLTDDGSTKGTNLDIAQLDPDGSEVSDPNVSLTSAQSKSLNERSLTLGASGGVHPDALFTAGSALFGTTSVSQFAAGGTRMRRTGLPSGTGVNSACTTGDGSSGTCISTSSCAAAGKTSTPDFCPGASNIQCCTTPSSSTNTGNSGDQTDGMLTTASAVVTAERWVAVQMPYCQAVEGGRELDASCFRYTGRTCNRPSSTRNSVWDRYRSDCSGLVSYAWGLRAPGLTTQGFLPSAAKYIPMQDLQPGDALIRPGHHIVLFKEWTNKSAGQAKVVSEPGCDARGGPHAQDQNWTMGRAPGSGSSAHWAGATYYSIRKKGGSLTGN